MKKLLIVAGPTASGKSALALALAETFGGVVINADSMQIYGGLRLLTARPGPAEEARAPHRLYGLLPPEDLCSAGRWRELATAECRQAWAAGRLPVVVGGTGLYLRGLLEGLSPVPPIAEAVRADSRALFSRLGNAAFHALLAERDPRMAARLHPGNSQRLMRAWEVLAATGRSLADWQERPAEGRLEADVFSILLEPPRTQLYAACDRRFLAMLEAGALDEARALGGRALDPALPLMKALGLPELLAHLRGEIALSDAVALAQQATRRYAKRQATWFRHQLAVQWRGDAQFSESLLLEILPLIRQFLLTPAG